jgi:hypothetical protein
MSIAFGLTRRCHERKLSSAGEMFMTARSHETIRVGLRRIIRDPNASISERLQATKLLMQVEGLMVEASHFASAKTKPAISRTGDANNNRLRELLEMAEEKKTG